MMKTIEIQKVVVLGSGGLRIGQAGEFDYSGSQAIKALKEEGIEVVLVNPNIATVQTDADMADATYLLPVAADSVECVIAKERPDGILLGFGGQSALNVGIALHDEGVLERYGVQVLGTPISCIRATEDRQIFKCTLETIGVQTPKSIVATSSREAIRASEVIRFPLMLRAGYSLGGLGSGVIHSREELEVGVAHALSVAPHVLIEEDLSGWKEIEYEVMRDTFDNAIIICNMENMDPLGIHTGESIVVAPSQTLTNREYHFLRELSLKAARAVGIVGEGNIQFALHPKTGEYRVIEMNARLSRSSALASKATGYPIAAVATKLALGASLLDLKNPVTGSTSAFFEPALDYLAVKIPRWDLQKFPGVDERIGTEMKSVGEVMALGRSFPECIQKAVRMLNTGRDGVWDGTIPSKPPSLEPRADRLFALAGFFARGASVEEVYLKTRIDPWFLHHIRDIALFAVYAARESLYEGLTAERLLGMKQLGFSDVCIARWNSCSSEVIRALRIKNGVVPSIKQIDTLAGEFPAQTNYVYCTYHGSENDIPPSHHAIAVVGSGPYSIGSSVEFDWCSVNTLRALRSRGQSTIMINSNPETVSTDYDESDRLYFEELTEERLRDIFDFENPYGIILSMGGQIPNTLSLPLANAGYQLLGTSAESVDRAEDRNKFSHLLDENGIPQPEWVHANNPVELNHFIFMHGFPVIVRPSYVLSGSSMKVVWNQRELISALDSIPPLSGEYPVLVSRFIEDAREFEIDAVAHRGVIVGSVMCEHIERAGVHSGDATVVCPPYSLSESLQQEALTLAGRIASALTITGPFNIQFLEKGGVLSVLECNLRASRSFPFVSKASGMNLAARSVSCFFGDDFETDGTLVPCREAHSFVKAPQFSLQRLRGSQVGILSVEMRSTGEVASFGRTPLEAFHRSWRSTEQTIGLRSILYLPQSHTIAPDILVELRQLSDAGWLVLTEMSSKQALLEYGIRSQGIPERVLSGLDLSLLCEQKKIGVALLLSQSHMHARRMMIDFSIPLLTDPDHSVFFLKSLIHSEEPFKNILPLQALFRSPVGTSIR